MPRYRFHEFTLSPRRRLLLRNGHEQPLIPRYFDLLVLLVERRDEAVHRRDIFERIWTDVVVTDSALSQAIRTIRRALGDDSREPRFVRTVSRHGYRFVWTDVVEEEDVDDPAVSDVSVRQAPDTVDVTALDATAPDATGPSRAPLPRWAGAALGGGAAGVAAGMAGAAILIALPGGVASFGLVPVLALIGGCCGAGGGGGVGAGIQAVERLTERPRRVLLVAGAAAGGCLAGSVAQWLGRWTLAALVGIQVPIGGALEGIVLGAAAGVGIVAATRWQADRAGELPVATGGGLAVIPLACAIGALALALSGRPLVGGTIHAIARASAGAQASLTPLAHLFGEPDFGALTAALLATGEGAMFGAGLALGLRGSFPDR